jgi:hypothetical protein
MRSILWRRDTHTCGWGFIMSSSYTYSVFLSSVLIRSTNQLNMKLTTSYLTIASAMSIAAATSCTHEVASPWPYTPEEPCATVACAQEQAYANCIAVSAVSPGRTCVRPPSMLKRDVDLDCATGETCTVFTDNSLLCLKLYKGG